MKTTQTLTLHLKLNVYKVGFLKQVIYGEYHLWITSLSSSSGTLHLVFSPQKPHLFTVRHNNSVVIRSSWFTVFIKLLRIRAATNDYFHYQIISLVFFLQNSCQNDMKMLITIFREPKDTTSHRSFGPTNLLTESSPLTVRNDEAKQQILTVKKLIPAIV